MEKIQLAVSIISPLIALIIGRRSRATLLWLYPFSGLVFDVTISFLKRGMHVNSNGLGNLFYLLEFIIVSLLYHRELTPRRHIISLIFVALASAFILHTCLETSVFRINKVGASLFSIAYIFYSLWGFYSLLKKQEMVQLEHSWFFWLNAAFLLYGSGSFFIFLLREFVVGTNPKAYKAIWTNIFLTLNVIKYILIGFALKCYKQNSIS